MNISFFKQIGRGGGTGPSLEFEIYLVNFLKNHKKKGFLYRTPLGKNRSSAPANRFLKIIRILPTLFFSLNPDLKKK